MTAREFPTKEFKDKAELFAALKENKQLLIDSKKAAVKFSDGILSKGIKLDSKKFDIPDGKIAAVINTTKYLDSHNDLHVDGIWSRSVSDNQGKLYYVSDHNLEVGSVIVYPGNLEVKLMDLSWSELGADFAGKTQALVYLFEEKDIVSEAARQAIERKAPVQNSVRMQYVNYSLAMDSPDADFKEEKAEWDEFFPMVANKERAVEMGYFWVVKEAKIYKEGSMVLSGSNDITPMNYGKSEPAVATPSHNEPPLGTQKSMNTIFF